MKNSVTVACGLTVSSAPGESRMFKNGIDVMELRQDVNVQMNSLRTNSTGQPTFGTFSVRTAYDKGSVKLYQLCAQGTGLNDVTIQYIVTRSGSQFVVSTTTLYSAYISKATIKTIAGEDGNMHPVMEFELSFQNIEVVYNQLGNDGLNQGSVDTGKLGVIANS